MKRYLLEIQELNTGKHRIIEADSFAEILVINHTLPYPLVIGRIRDVNTDSIYKTVSDLLMCRRWRND